MWTAGHLPYDLGQDATIEEQTQNVLDNLEATLGAAGAGFYTLIKTNVYLLDWDDKEAFNTIYLERLGRFGTPPRTTVQVARLGAATGSRSR